jgi:hypothetical protein
VIRAVVTVLALVVGARTDAQADEVAIEIDPCVDGDHDELRRLIELEQRGIDPPSGGSLDALIACDGDVIVVRLRDGTTTFAERRVDGRIPVRARNRTIAVVLAEMVAIRVLRPDQPPVAIATRVAAESRPMIPAARTWRAGVLAVGRAFRETSFTTVGGGVVVERDLGPHFAFVADVALEARRVAVSEATADVLVTSAGLCGAIRLRAAWLSGTVHAGARGGLASVHGSGAAGRTVAGTWSGAVTGARGWVDLGAVALALGVEAGLVLQPVVGTMGGAAAIAIDGPWFAGTIIVAVEL